MSGWVLGATFGLNIGSATLYTRFPEKPNNLSPLHKIV